MDTLSRRACLDECFRKHGYVVERAKSLGSHAVRIVGFRPPDDGFSKGIVQIPGFAAQESTYLPQLHRLMHEGVSGCVVVPEVAGTKGAAVIQGALKRLADGDLAVFQPDEITVAGHSLGANKAARAMVALNESGEERFKRLILQAPACLGGFSWWWAGAAVTGSMIQEAPYMLRPSQSAILLEAQQYCVTHPQDILGELALVESDTAKPTLRRLMGEFAVGCVGIQHPHDRLIHAAVSARAMRELGIPVVDVDGAVIGHNAQLYADTVPAFTTAFELLDASQQLPHAA